MGTKERRILICLASLRIKFKILSFKNLSFFLVFRTATKIFLFRMKIELVA
jgi:hypothetical protein